MKPVMLKGHILFENQIQVLRYQNGDKGVDLIAPMFTHLDKDDKPCGIMVNRGWVPWDLKDFRQDRNNSSSVVQGILYRGDAKTKYSKPNQPLLSNYTSAYPEELALVSQLPNAESHTFMLKAIDFDAQNRTALPDVPAAEDLSTFGISSERHEAYETLWNCFTYCGVLANTAFWLYL